MFINLENAHPHVLVRLRLKRNEEIKKLLDVENKIIKLEMLIVYRRLAHNTEYKSKVDEMNKLDLAQLTDYRLSREHEIKSLASIINGSEANVQDLKDDIEKLRPELLQAIENIKLINAKMPHLIVASADLPEDVITNEKYSPSEEGL